MQIRRFRFLGTILVVILVLTGLLVAGCGGTEEASTTTAVAPATTAGPATTAAPPTTAAPATTTAPPTTAAPAQEAMNLTFSFGGPNKGAFAETNQWFVDEIAKALGRCDQGRGRLGWHSDPAGRYPFGGRQGCGQHGERHGHLGGTQLDHTVALWRRAGRVGHGDGDA